MRAVEFHKQGLDSKLIASQLGIDDSLVRKWIRKYKAYGIESLRPYSRGISESKGKSDKQFLEAYQAYATTLGSISSIARQYGLNYYSFRYHLLRYHPELKERRDALIVKG